MRRRGREEGEERECMWRREKREGGREDGVEEGEEGGREDGVEEGEGEEKEKKYLTFQTLEECIDSYPCNVGTQWGQKCLNRGLFARRIGRNKCYIH